MATYRDRCRDVWEASGWLGLSTYWLRTAVTFATDGLLERLVALRKPMRDYEPAGALAGLGRDLRFALRWYAKQPSFFFVALVTMALGIGSTTTIYSVVDGVLFRPLPYPNADRLVHVGVVFQGLVRMAGI